MADVTFRVNSGAHSGEKFKFTLASQKGQKQWAIAPVFKPSPSILKEQIVMQIAARSYNIPSTSAMELRSATKILEDLRMMALEDYVTLEGFDKQERRVRIPQNGYTVYCITNEQGRDPEYGVELVCWGLWDW